MQKFGALYEFANAQLQQKYSAMKEIRYSMTRKSLLLIVALVLGGMATQLKAGKVTYDFTSVENWVTKSGGDTHPGTGSSALLKNFYHAATNDDFVGEGNVYFSADGYLMISTDASLKVPYRSDWTITKITLHAHSECSTSAKVNIYSEYGTSLSTAQQWKQKDSDYEYVISTSYRKLFVKSEGAAARITSITIEYTSPNDTDDPSGDDSDVSSVSAPVFTPGSSSFSTASLTVSIDAAERCEVYYTIDGSAPSYTSPEEYHGTKGREVTIVGSASPIILQAIAVDPATSECSDISSATYTYVEVKNDGSKSKPYTVAELRTMSYSTNKQDLWVRGTICGALDGSNKLVTSGITIETNIAIGDENAHVAVQLPSNSKLRNHANLKDHPYMMGKELLVKGDLVQYLVPFVGVTGPTDYEISYNVPINSYGCATLFLDMPVALPSGAMAYYCTAEGDKVQLLPIEGVIPDSVGVILEYLPNETCRLIHTTEVNVIEDSIRKTNQLVGFTAETLVEADGYAYYALNVKDNVLGFYIPQTAVDAEDTASGFTAKANKAYLSVPAAQKSQRYVIRRLGNETSVVLVPHLVDDRIYDLQGRVVTSPDPRIYIRAGKKVVIR